MLPYIIPVIFILYGVVKYDFNNEKRGKSLLWILIFGYFILLIGLRYKVGGDTINYMGDYEWRVPLNNWEISFIDRYQPGYTLLCALCKSISPEFYVFQIVHAFIINCALAIWIPKNTKYIYSSLFAFFLISYLYFSTEVLREALAVIIFLFNYKNLVKHKWIKYYAGVVLSCFFHLSAVILFLFPFFTKIRFNQRYLLLLILAIGLSWGSIKIIKGLSDMLLIAEKAEGYAGVSTGFMAGAYRLVTTSLFPILYGFIASYKRKREIKFEWMIGLMGLLGMMTVFNPIIFGRFSNYLVLFYCISFASCIMEWFKSKYTVRLHNAVILSFLFVLTYGIGFKMYNKYTLWVPYYSILNPKDVNREFAVKMLHVNY